MMSAAGEKFLVSISSPLELTLVYHIKSQSSEDLGNAIQAPVSTLCSRGFEPKTIFVDPHRTNLSLENAYPGIAIDATGVGDHLEKLDSKVRRIKEMMRSVIAGLPYKISKNRIKDLATYVVSRINLKQTQALNDNLAPRVKFTGVQPDFNKEYGLSFGNYVECYDPKSHQESNNILMPRTEPCIPLYPSANCKGSWMFLNLNTGSYVCRSQWKKLPVNGLVVKKMDELAVDQLITTADFGEEEPGSMTEERTLPTTHIPPNDADVIMTQEEMMVEQTVEDISMPELMDQDKDVDSES